MIKKETVKRMKHRNIVRERGDWKREIPRKGNKNEKVVKKKEENKRQRRLKREEVEVKEKEVRVGDIQ